MAVRTFPVEVFHHPAEGGDPEAWRAACDALAVNIDAATLDALLARLNVVLPDMFESLVELDERFAAANRDVTPRFEIRYVLGGGDEGLLQASA